MISRTLDFITKLLKNTLKLDMHYFLEPYNDLPGFDLYLRDSLERSQDLYDEVRSFIQEMDHHTFHIVTDSYMLNYIFFYPYEEKNELITIGPYFNKPVDEKYWQELTEQHNLTISNIQHLKSFIYGMPVINTNLHIISTIGNIVSYINPDATPFSVQYHDLSNEMKTGILYQPKTDFDAYSRKVEQRYRTEKELLQYISAGDRKAALEAARKFISAPFEPRLTSTLREQKSLLITANTLFRKAIEPNEIHPIFLHEISSKFVNYIENALSETALDQLYEKMIREYCLLVKTKSTKQYSHCVRQTLYFIDFNLDAKINLSDLAEKYNVSVPYLSNLFKKEVGTTIIKYINKLRIERAKTLLNSSSLSIQDIAIHVGIYDHNYFTKVFKKEVGVAPTDFRSNSYQEKL
jgi:AraC-like DNA-binding protein